MTTTFNVTDDFLEDYIRLVLFYKWDPIRVSGYRMSPEDIQNTGDDILKLELKPTTFAMGFTEDEYDGYMHSVKELMIQHRSEKEIYRYLRDVEIHCMSDGNAANTKSAARRLFTASQHLSVNPHS